MVCATHLTRNSVSKKERCVKNLEVSFHTYAGEVKAVRGVSFEAKAGECLAIVGESGSGKTVTSKAVLGLIATPPGDVKKTSEIIFDGQNIMRP